MPYADHDRQMQYLKTYRQRHKAGNGATGPVGVAPDWGELRESLERLHTALQTASQRTPYATMAHLAYVVTLLQDIIARLEKE